MSGNDADPVKQYRDDLSKRDVAQAARAVVSQNAEVDEDPRTLTPLEACIIYLTSELDRPITRAALFAAISNPAGTLTVKDALRAAEQAGFVAAFGPRTLRRFDDTLLPAILLLEGDRAVVLHRLDVKVAVVADPAMGGRRTELPLDKLASAYTGYAVILRAEVIEDVTRTYARLGHWFWSALAASRWHYTQVILAAVVTSVLGLSTSIFTMVVYDRILPNEATESLIALTIGVAVALIFDFLLKMLRAGFIDQAGERADMMMGRRIFDQLLDLRLADRPGSTGAMANTLREFEALRDFFTSASLVALVDLPFILLFIFVIYQISGPLAYIPMVAVPVVLAVGLAVQPFLARLAERGHADGQSKQSVLVETISGLEAIKVSGAARHMRARWEAAIQQQSRHGGQSRAFTQFALNATAFVQQIAQVAIIFYGVFLIAEGVTSMGALIAAVILTGRCLAPLAQLAQTLTRINQARVSYRNLNQIMQTESERPDKRNWISRPSLQGRITFQDVRFTYPNQMVETLKGVSFTIEPGEKVAILGRIGSGKSTLVRLLLGLYRPSSGAVLVDGVDIRQIDPGDLRRNMGVVLQDVWLFSGTLRDNIAIGGPRPLDSEVLRAAQVAGVEEFVSRHPLGYDMVLGEKGDGLSGGQKQTINLARALVGRPPILLLDEPTSAMDIQKEAEVIANLRDAVGDATLVIVTHRTSLLELVDRVIVLGDGVVQVDGPKSSLRRTEPGAKRTAGSEARA